MNRQRNAQSPRLNVNADKASSDIACNPSVVPAWNRERLIRQFQGIDGSTRSEAEMQIDAFERSFWEVFAASLRKREASVDTTE